MQKYGKYEIKRTNAKQGYSWAIVDSGIIAIRPLLFFHSRFNAEEVLKILESDRRGVRHSWG